MGNRRVQNPCTERCLGLDSYSVVCRIHGVSLYDLCNLQLHGYTAVSYVELVTCDIRSISALVSWILPINSTSDLFSFSAKISLLVGHSYPASAECYDSSPCLKDLLNIIFILTFIISEFFFFLPVYRSTVEAPNRYLNNLRKKR